MWRFEFCGKQGLERMAQWLGVGIVVIQCSCRPCCGGLPSRTSSAACPINANAEFTGNFFSLLSAYTLLGGLATLAIFFAHGAIFLEMRTEGIVNQRVRQVAARAIPAALVVGAAFLAWTIARQGPVEPVSAVLAGLAVVAMLVATLINARAVGRAFVATSVAIAAFFSAIFVDLFPNTMVSSTSSAFDMTLNFSSSSDYTLTVMTVVAALLVPLVLMYQAWTYWVFRRRVSAEGFGDVKTPLDLLDQQKREGGDGTDGDPGSGQQPAGP
jgi:cytochrome bd ubiquinol oxidase subunit II